MKEVQLFVCHDIEQGYIDSMYQEYEREYAEYQTGEDFRCEHELALDHIDDLEEGCENEWPWYADEPFEVCDPEIIST